MPVTYIGSTLKASGVTGSFTATKPTGVVSGHLLIAVHSCNVVALSNMTISGGATWNLGASLDTLGYGGRHSLCKAWWRYADSAEPASYTFGQAATAEGVVTLLALDGADPAAAPVFNLLAGTLLRATTVDTPGITPTNADDFEIRVAIGNNNISTGTWSFPAATPALTSLANIASGTATDHRVAYRTLTSNADPGTITATHTTTADNRQGLTIAVAAVQPVTPFSGWGVPL
ncbi:hypothetical protein ACFY05_32820 [Microtetraspora fusca]|uniref:Phage tail protein n=1 Tax=Microtetraspora fusca TaxID=1997 RepID=A0ABW6VFC9_MICFU